MISKWKLVAWLVQCKMEAAAKILFFFSQRVIAQLLKTFKFLFPVQKEQGVYYCRCKSNTLLTILVHSCLHIAAASLVFLISLYCALYSVILV